MRQRLKISPWNQMVLNATVGVTTAGPAQYSGSGALHIPYTLLVCLKKTLLDYFRPNPLLLVARLSLIVKGLIRFAID
jgi:hypothetical protein